MSGPLVLLTGATGHIGFRTLLRLLDAGYHVRIAIRKPEQEHKIRQARSMAQHSSRVDFVLIPDMTAAGAYDDAMQSIEYVVHVASPIPLKPYTSRLHSEEGQTWRQVYYDPAINGTLGILQAASKPGSRVKRVVVTASGNVLTTAVPASKDSAALKPAEIRPCPSMEEAEAVDNAGQAYKMSKILAVTAAQDFVAAHRAAGLGFDVVYVCPGYVQGAHELCASVEELMTTTSAFAVNVAIGNELGGMPNVSCTVWVDDVARAHVESLTSPKVRGGDALVLVANQEKCGYPWDEVARLMCDMFPREIEAGVLKPATSPTSMLLSFNGRSTEEKLGWEFKGPEVWAREVVEQYLTLREKTTSHPSKGD